MDFHLCQCIWEEQQGEKLMIVDVQNLSYSVMNNCCLILETIKLLTLIIIIITVIIGSSINSNLVIYLLRVKFKIICFIFTVKLWQPGPR